MLPATPVREPPIFYTVSEALQRLVRGLPDLRKVVFPSTMFHVRSLAVLLIPVFLAASSASAQLIFEDVREEAGLDQFTYYSNTYHDLGINWIDFDNDYDADLFVTTGTGEEVPHLYRNNGDSTFTLVDELLPPLRTDVNTTVRLISGSRPATGCRKVG